MNASLTLARDGAERHAGRALPLLDRLEAVFAPGMQGSPGVRLHGLPALADLLGADGAIGGAAAQAIGAGARPVRAILFDKRETANWALGWHQDRTVAVAARRTVPGYGPWTVKRGIVHVALLENMVTLRVHLDPVDACNAPLLIAPGSHRALVPEGKIAAEVARCGIATCPAARGDVWLYATPILHASERARAPARRRRVLQIDYSTARLPEGLSQLPKIIGMDVFESLW
ncbi:phytanoyl-CoA dioxygenase family protein [Sphingomonas sp. MMS12-HWE2-04]|uniref:phytanoyl-CoA dioxygenase family protein n=1 Tax=Sphingomonas sp. MMS12-HWE2-04 TaxID=3234199 RepID=UPI00385007C9